MSLNVSDDVGPVMLDRRAFRQVMFNLLENAFRYGLQGGSIEVIAVRASPHQIIRVRNQGPGVAPNHEEIIFQPFYTASPSGPGLGLYVARKLVEGMNGQLRLTRTADPTEFSIYLSEALWEQAE